MKIAVVGSRDFANVDLVVDFVASLPADWEVVSGGAVGPDSWAVDAARCLGLTYTIYYPQVKFYGPKQAPLERNKLIADDADILVGFWSGRSGGTLDVARKMGERRKPALLVRDYEEAPTVEYLLARLAA